MLRTRLWVGTVLVVLMVGVLVIDQHLAPWYPFLYLTLLGLGLAGCRELLHLLAAWPRPPAWLCYAGVAGVVTANWLPHVTALERLAAAPALWVAGALVVFVLATFVVEMARFREPGGSVVRIALAVLAVAY